MGGLNSTQDGSGRRARRGVIASAMLLGLLLAGVAWGEVAGWPFIAPTLARALSSSLHRRVVLAPEGFRARFIGGLAISARHLEIGAPPWSSAPTTLNADDVSLRLRYIDLWRAGHGAPLRIASLQAAALVAHLERAADGRTSWSFGPNSPPPDPAVAPVAPPRWDDLRVADGTLHYRDAPLALSLDARFALRDGIAEPPGPVAAAGPAASVGAAAPVPPASAGAFTFHATGLYGSWPVRIDLVAAGVLPWLAEGRGSAPVPMTLEATVGRAHLAFQGLARDALHLGGLSGRFVLEGPSLAAVGDPLHVTLPTTAPFRAQGRVGKQAEQWRIEVDEATVGRSRLRATLDFDARSAVRRLSGKLTGERVVLADLGPAFGTTAPRGAGKLLPDHPFDLAALRAMDADILVDLAELDLGTPRLEPLRPLRAHLTLAGGVLALTGIDARSASGRIDGTLVLDGHAPVARWLADIRWQDLALEQWIHQARAGGAPPYVSGQLHGRATLRGQGQSTAGILGSLDGSVRAELRDGKVSHLAVEAAGLDIAQGLGMWVKGDDSLPVQCAVADLVAHAGVLRPRVMVLDTRDSVLWLAGDISLADETLALRMVVVPRDFSPLSLRGPLHLSGPFAHPVVSIDKGPIARKLGAALLLAFVNPLAAVLPLIDLGNDAGATRDAAGCAGLMQRATLRSARS